MVPRITIEVRQGIAAVVTKTLSLPESHGRAEKPAIAIEIRDYDIEGGVHDKDVIKRGYSREITEITVKYPE